MAEAEDGERILQRWIDHPPDPEVERRGDVARVHAHAEEALASGYEMHDLPAPLTDLVDPGTGYRALWELRDSSRCSVDSYLDWLLYVYWSMHSDGLKLDTPLAEANGSTPLDLLRSAQGDALRLVLAARGHVF